MTSTRYKSWAGALATVSASLTLPPELSAQCAMCRTTLVSSAEGQAVAAGFNQGILFLLSVPFLVVAFLAVIIVRTRRRGSDSVPSSLVSSAIPFRSANE